MKRTRVEDVLRAAGRAEAPAPRPEVVDAIEARLTSTHIVHASPLRLRRAPALTIAAALIAAIAGLGLLVRNDDSAGVRTEQPATTAPPATAPTGTSTTVRGLDASSATSSTTSTSTTTTTTAPHATTSLGAEPTTTIPPATTTTTEHRESTTTTEPHASTTTTTEPAPAHLALTCTTASSPSPMVTCTWTASTDARLDHYRLWKHTADGPAQEVYAGTAREAHDSDVQVGAQLIYEVTALAADGTVLAHGDMRVSCC